MSIKSLKSKIIQVRKNAFGWRTNRKIIVFESDDWGSIRMPSREVYQKLLDKGLRVDKSKYNKYDALESEKDIESLFHVLKSVKDVNGRNPVFTANCVMANPDFDKIKSSGFREYHFESIIETFKKYSMHNKSFDLWKQGINDGIFFPQFHGREHLNVNRWLEALREGSEETMLAFDNYMFGLSVLITKEKRRSYMAAYDYDLPEEVELHKNIIKEGLDMFEDLFGFRSESFIAPNGTWDPSLASVLDECGVKYIQGGSGQKVPSKEGTKFVKHKLGERNKLNQIYLMRNVQFEPTSNPNRDWLNSTLNEISFAFKFNKPAVISTHRINYSGYIFEENRDSNIETLQTLLKQIVKKWPSVEFMTTIDLAKLIDK